MRDDDVEDWLDQLDPHDPSAKVRDGVHMRRIAVAADRQESVLRDAVVAARAAGDTWAMIGLALGVSSQAAELRFGTET